MNLDQNTLNQLIQLHQKINDWISLYTKNKAAQSDTAKIEFFQNISKQLLPDVDTVLKTNNVELQKPEPDEDVAELLHKLHIYERKMEMEAAALAKSIKAIEEQKGLKNDQDNVEGILRLIRRWLRTFKDLPSEEQNKRIADASKHIEQQKKLNSYLNKGKGDTSNKAERHIAQLRKQLDRIALAAQPAQAVMDRVKSKEPGEDVPNKDEIIQIDVYHHRILKTLEAAEGADVTAKITLKEELDKLKLVEKGIGEFRVKYIAVATTKPEPVVVETPKEEVVESTTKEPTKEETVVEAVIEEVTEEQTVVEPPQPVYANKKLTGSVGRNGANVKEDVKLVQEVLNKKGAKLETDGLSGPATRKAIADFQLSIGFKKADSRVDPDGMTWKALIKGLDVVPEEVKEETSGQGQSDENTTTSTDQNTDNQQQETTEEGEEVNREQGGTTIEENTTLDKVLEDAPNLPENEPTFEVPEKALSELGNKAIPETTGIKELDELLKKERLTSEEIAAARKYVASLSDAALRASLFRHLNAKVSYHSQRDNQSVGESESWDWTQNSDGSKNMMVGEKIGDIQCNLTSLSMVLESLGISNPEGGMQFEDYLEKKGRDMSKAMDGDGDGKADGDVNYFLRDNPFGADEYDWDGVMDAESIGWGDVAQEMGAKVDQLVKEATCDKDWFVENVLPRLDVGQGIILSIHGHVVRLQDMNKEGLIIDDPYGKLNVARGSFDQSNGQGEVDPQIDNAGEDNIWKWDDVKQNKFTRVVAVYK